MCVMCEGLQQIARLTAEVMRANVLQGEAEKLSSSRLFMLHEAERVLANLQDKNIALANELVRAQNELTGARKLLRQAVNECHSYGMTDRIGLFLKTGEWE